MQTADKMVILIFRIIRKSPHGRAGARQRKEAAQVNGFFKTIKQRVLAACAALLILSAGSVVQAAEMPVAAVYPSVQQQELEQWGLDDQAVILQTRTTANPSGTQTVSAASELSVFYPGDCLLVPVCPGSYQEGSFQKQAGSPLRGIPQNWEISLQGKGTAQVKETGWYLDQEGNLLVRMQFLSSAVGTQTYPVDLSLSIRDSQGTERSNTVRLVGSFQNRSKTVCPGILNQVISPMTLLVGENAGKTVSLAFENGVTYRNTALAGDVYLNLDCSYDNKLANRLRRFDLSFYHFLGEEDTFAQAGQLRLPAPSQEACVYEVKGSELVRVPAEYDEASGCLCFATEALGYYVVSSGELLLD